jgi:hypothetical protein
VESVHRKEYEEYKEYRRAQGVQGNKEYNGE